MDQSVVDLVRRFVLVKYGRMPESEQEVNEYLDLLNMAREYIDALILEELIGPEMMERLGVKTAREIRNAHGVD